MAHHCFQRSLESNWPLNAVASLRSATPVQEPPLVAKSTSQLADELLQYATAIKGMGARPIEENAFLKLCLNELSRPERIRRLRPRQLASLLRSLVHLGLQPGEDWLADLDACCYCHPGPFDPSSATTVLESLALLHHSTAAQSQPAQPQADANATSDNEASGSRQSVGNTRAAASGRATHRTPGCRQPNAHARPRSYLASSSSSPPAAALPSGSGSTSASVAARTASQPDARPAPFRFPYAVYLRLLQGGAHKYSYEQLSVLLKSFRSLGVPVTDELASVVGSRMAAQLLEMAPERQQRVLAAVMAQC